MPERPACLRITTSHIGISHRTELQTIISYRHPWSYKTLTSCHLLLWTEIADAPGRGCSSMAPMSPMLRMSTMWGWPLSECSASCQYPSRPAARSNRPEADERRVGWV